MTKSLTLTALTACLALAACGGPGAQPRTGSAPAGGIQVDPAAQYCQGTGGQVIPRTQGGRRADLCRTPDGRTVRAADLLNAHNDL